MQLFYNQPI